MLKKDLEQELNRTKLILDYAREELKLKDNIIKEAIEYINKLKNFKIKYVMLEEKELYASEKDFVRELLDILRGESNE